MASIRFVHVKKNILSLCAVIGMACVCMTPDHALAQQSGVKFFPLDRKAPTVQASRRYHINKVDGNLLPSSASHRFYPGGMEMPVPEEPRRGDEASVELQPQTGLSGPLSEDAKSSLILSLFENQKNKMSTRMTHGDADPGTPLRDPHRIPFMQ